MDDKQFYISTKFKAHSALVGWLVITTLSVPLSLCLSVSDVHPPTHTLPQIHFACLLNVLRIPSDAYPHPQLLTHPHVSICAHTSSDSLTHSLFS